MSYSLARTVAATAPGGLALAQGILNTRATGSGAIDLLADEATAAEWLGDALAEWSAITGIEVPDAVTADRHQLSRLRARVREFVSGDSAAGAGVPVRVVTTRDGSVRLEPIGAGIDWVSSAAWAGILIAGQADQLKRLKLCRNEPCGTAFYDRSKNNSGVWHDALTCGNVAHLRASRARRAAQEG